MHPRSPAALKGIGHLVFILSGRFFVLPESDRQMQVRMLANTMSRVVQLTEEIEARAAFLNAQGFAVFDALHIACAEAGSANVLLTTDDRLLRRALRQSDMLEVRVANPVQWLLEVTGDTSE